MVACNTINSGIEVLYIMPCKFRSAYFHWIVYCLCDYVRRRCLPSFMFMFINVFTIKQKIIMFIFKIFSHFVNHVFVLHLSRIVINRPWHDHETRGDSSQR